MGDRENLEPWRDYIKMAQNWEEWAKHLETRGDPCEAAAVRRAVNGYRAKASG